jgi:hypothetical protein
VPLDGIINPSLKVSDKKQKINITVDNKHVKFLKKLGPTISEAIRKLIDEKMALDK